MEEVAYKNWREKLANWLAEHAARQIAAECAHPASKPVLEVLAQARQIVAGINATAAGISIQDLNKYDHLASILDTVLAMESFSLAEYTYNLPGDKHPGARLWYEAPNGSPRITLLLFEDVHEWRVDAGGKKISWQTLRLELSSGNPVPELPEGTGRYISTGGDWRGALCDAFCLPVRLFDTP